MCVCVWPKFSHNCADSVLVFGHQQAQWWLKIRHALFQVSLDFKMTPYDHDVIKHGRRDPEALWVLSVWVEGQRLYRRFRLPPRTLSAWYCESAQFQKKNYWMTKFFALLQLPRSFVLKVRIRTMGVMCSYHTFYVISWPYSEPVRTHVW